MYCCLDAQDLKDVLEIGCEVMQYIGLKDKNRKEIYEGDIIQFDDGERYRIYWNEENAGYKMKIIWKSEDFSLRPEKWEIKNTCSVIGNIYENKELLYVK